MDIAPLVNSQVSCIPSPPVIAKGLSDSVEMFQVAGS